LRETVEMESIGAKLNAARSDKGVSIEQAARDTHIAKRYLIALEAEEFEEFPGEVYLLGFLRSYAEYLDLDGQELVTIYHNILLQEQPPPIDELLDRHGDTKRVRRVVTLVLIAIIVGTAAVLVFTGIIPLRQHDVRQRETPVAENAPFRLDEQFVERRFEEGDIVIIPVDGIEATLEFVSVDDRVAVGSDAGIVRLSAGERQVLDITGEGSGDISLSISQIYAEDDPRALVARVDRVVESPGRIETETTEVSETDRESLAIGRTNEPTRELEATVITRFDQAQEYFIEADIRGFTMFRWEVDDQPREERYLQNGDRLRTSATDLVRIWVSNAGNVRLRVAGVPVELGDQGEVVASVIRWGQSDGGGVQLELLPLY
jgi:hypothetical protein